MAVKTSYGSITMVDIGDLGELSVVPMSNQPSMVVYDPDTNTYLPDWSTSNLVLTPTIYYAGTQLSSSTQGLSVSWYENSEQATPTSTYALTVSTNKLSSSDYITYIVVVEYIESSSGVTLRAKGQISFSKVSNAFQAVVFQIFTPNGNVINNETNTITVSPKLTEGSNEVTITSNMIQWYVYTGSGYDEIETSASTNPIYKDGVNLIITPAGVSSYLSVKAAVTYTPTGMPNSNTYEAYQSVYDKSDLFQVEVVSTLGDKLLNSEGVGIIYTKITKNGVLYDGIVSTAVATSNTPAAFNTAVAKPGVIGTNPSNYCWYCTSSSLALYSKKSSTSWPAVSSSSDPHTVKYEWTGTHNAISSAPTSASIYGWGNNKAILLNGNLVNRKTTFNVTASSLI